MPAPNTSGSLPLYYCDSCIFIDFLNDNPASNAEKESHEAAFALLEHGQKRECRIVTSIFSFSEVCKIKNPGNLSAEAQEERIEALMNQVWIEKVSYERKVAKMSRMLARQYSIKPHDSIHLATALRVDADCLMTTDIKFIKKTQALKDLIDVKQPDISSQTALFKMDCQNTGI